ncbi:MAG TPA: MATE family efflux transporter [Candidatus Acidoferrales bacterium]|nr:MATE family efflux transporter [Candidatus Acidoferrales bacterium]
MIAKVEAVPVSDTRRLSGGIAEVARLAYPAVLQTLSDTAMQVTDSAIVGRLGVTELGAVGFGGVWLWTMLVAFVGTATGVQTFVSQAFGAGETRSCGRWAWQGLYVLVPLTALWVGVIAVGFQPLLRVLGPSPELQTLATRYVHARLFGAPAVIAGVALTSFFRGLGDTRTPLVGTVFANLLNALLAIGLVFGRFGLPAWGVAGAGTATACANWTYTGIMLGAFLRRRMRATYATRPVRPDRDAIRRFVRTSMPVGGQWVLDMTSFALFSTIIARMGNAPMAASQAMIQLLSLSFMQAFGISIASGALVGRYIGAADLASAERSHRSAMQLGLALAVLVALIFLAIPDTLLSIFTRDPVVVVLGRRLLALGAVFQLLDAIGIVAGGSLRGAGDTRWPFMVQTMLAWCVRLPLVYVLAVVLGRGVIGAWLGELGYVAVLGSVWLLRFRAGAWREIRI